VAARLGIATVLVPPDAGLLSAVGLGAAVVERFAQRQVLRPLDELDDELPRLLAELAAEARSAVLAELTDGAGGGGGGEGGDGRVEVRRRILHLRFVGQEATESVETDAAAEPAAVRAAFADAYRRRYGYLPEARPLELESVRVVASVASGREPAAAEIPEAAQPPPAGERRAYLDGAWRPLPVHLRRDLAPGARLAGPALVYEEHGATVVEPGWSLAVDAAGSLVLTAGSGSAG
jgi:5-oxoprolinase (ATP-hydrolysing)